MNLIMTIFANIKSCVIGIGAAVIAFFVWKNNSDRKKAETSLKDLQTSMAKDSAKVEVEIKEAQKEASEALLNTEIDILEKRDDIEVKAEADLSKVEETLKGVKENETVTISI